METYNNFLHIFKINFKFPDLKHLKKIIKN